MNEKNEIKSLIRDYITKEECEYMCDETVFDCFSCSCFTECHMTAEIRCNNDLNDIFAKSIGYGGYDSVEEFWEQIFD